MIKRLRIITLSLLMTITAVVPAAVSAATDSTTPAATSTAKTCEQKAALVNYRSDILTLYKNSEAKAYQTFRKTEANYIAYASQWQPAKAESTRALLYQYDALHTTTTKAIDAQITAYTPLKTKPLDCSTANKAALTAKLADIDGLKNKRAVSGNALIALDKQQETQFLSKKYHDSKANLVKAVHKTAAKHPSPEHPKISVKAS